MIRKRKKQRDFFQMSNKPIQDANLSWEARGMLAYLMSLPEDWEISLTDLEKRCTHSGRDKTRRIFTELIENGYAQRTPARDSETGQFSGQDYEIDDEKGISTDLLKTRMSANPHVGKPATTKKHNSTKKQITKASKPEKAQSVLDEPPQNAVRFFQQFLPLQTVEKLDRKINLNAQLLVWGEDNLIELWRECLALHPRREGDTPSFRYEDALTGRLETTAKPYELEKTVAHVDPAPGQVWRNWDTRLSKILESVPDGFVVRTKHGDGTYFDETLPPNALLEFIGNAATN